MFICFNEAFMQLSMYEVQKLTSIYIVKAPTIMNVAKYYQSEVVCISRNYDMFSYYNKMLGKFSYSENLFSEKDGCYLTIEEFDKQIYKDYNVRIILSGRNVVVTKYRYYALKAKFSFKTGELLKIHSYNTRNMRDKYIRLMYANQDILKTFITLTFADDVDADEASKAFQAWVRKVKKCHKDFQYVRVLAKNGEGRIHYHLLSSLDVTDPIIVAAATSDDNQYNLTNWKYGFSLVEKIADDKHFRSEVFYIVKNFNEQILGSKRKFGQSKGLKQPKVFYYNSKLDCKKIDSFIKHAVPIEQRNYTHFFGSFIEQHEFMING